MRDQIMIKLKFDTRMTNKCFREVVTQAFRTYHICAKS
jgi:hypothetical protein